MPKTNVEYATDQITVYRSCPYRCDYCWAWRIPLMRSRILRGKYDPLEEAKKYLRCRRQRTIVVSFTSDPYPPDELERGLTRSVLKILSASKHNIMVLTKNPLIALRDVDILVKRNFMLGTTVISLFPNKYEKYAPRPELRLDALKIAHELGVKTWLSIEPIIPHISFNLCETIFRTYKFIDYYVLGAINYAKQLNLKINIKGLGKWYRENIPYIIEILREMHKPYFIKKELARYLEGIEYDNSPPPFH